MCVCVCCVCVLCVVCVCLCVCFEFPDATVYIYKNSEWNEFAIHLILCARASSTFQSSGLLFVHVSERARGAGGREGRERASVCV